MHALFSTLSLRGIRLLGVVYAISRVFLCNLLMNATPGPLSYVLRECTLQTCKELCVLVIMFESTFWCSLFNMSCEMMVILYMNLCYYIHCLTERFMTMERLA